MFVLQIATVFWDVVALEQWGICAAMELSEWKCDNCSAVSLQLLA